MKFKKGDIVQHKQTKEIDTILSVPGMSEYDKRGYSKASEGMSLENEGWNFQHNWKLVKNKNFKKGDILCLVKGGKENDMTAETGALARVIHEKREGYIKIKWIDKLAGAQMNGEYYETDFIKHLSESAIDNLKRKLDL